MSFEWINETVVGAELIWVLWGRNDPNGLRMAQVGLEWPKLGQNGPSVLDVYLMYLFEAQAIRNGYCIFEGRSNMYVTLQTNIERNKHTSLSKAIKLPLSR